MENKIEECEKKIYMFKRGKRGYLRVEFTGLVNCNLIELSRLRGNGIKSKVKVGS